MTGPPRWCIEFDSRRLHTDETSDSDCSRSSSHWESSAGSPQPSWPPRADLPAVTPANRANRRSTLSTGAHYISSGCRDGLPDRSRGGWRGGRLPDSEWQATGQYGCAPIDARRPSGDVDAVRDHHRCPSRGCRRRGLQRPPGRPGDANCAYAGWRRRWPVTHGLREVVRAQRVRRAVNLPVR